MKVSPVVTYSTGRVLVFLVVTGLLALLGFRSWALVLIALPLSMPLSYVVLRRPRRAFAEHLRRRSQERGELRSKLEGDVPPP